MGTLPIAILLGLATLTSQERQNSKDINKLLKLPEMENALQQIIALAPLSGLDGSGDHSSHHGKHHSKSHKNPNLMNIQNLNLVFKNNNLRKKHAKAQQSQLNPPKNPQRKILRNIENAICKTTGRCGCSGDRCNEDRKDQTGDSKELSKLLDSLQNDIENDQKSSNDKVEQSLLNNLPENPNQKVLRDIENAICEATGRCGCSGDRCNDDRKDRSDERKDRSDDRKDLSKLLDSIQNDIGNDQKSHNGLRCGCRNNKNQWSYNPPQRGHRPSLRCGCGRRPYKRTGKHDKQKDNNEPGKTLEIDEDLDLDVVLNELNDLFDKTINYRDYTRTKDEGLPREVNFQLESDDKSNVKVREINPNKKKVSPEEMFGFYQLFKARTIKKLMDHILYHKDEIDLSKLSKRQQEIIKNLQDEVPKFKSVDTAKLEERLLNLLFGPESEVKVLPHRQKNDNIYVPRWAYENMRSSQANLPNSQDPHKKHTRSIFPLTKYQKLKLQKIIQKQQREKTSGRLWRRSLSEDLQNYGTPFELDIQGLGQVNP